MSTEKKEDLKNGSQGEAGRKLISVTSSTTWPSSRATDFSLTLLIVGWGWWTFWVRRSTDSKTVYEDWLKIKKNQKSIGCSRQARSCRSRWADQFSDQWLPIIIVKIMFYDEMFKKKKEYFQYFSRTKLQSWK